MCGIKQTARILGISLAVFLVLLIALFGLAQTEAGKRQVTAIAGMLLSEGPDVKVQFGRLEGMVPFDLRLDHFSVSDKGGIWLEVADATFRWSVADLLRGRIHITELGAAAIELTRMPKGGEVKKPAETRPPEGLKWLQSLIVDRVSVDRLAIGTEVLGEKAVFELKGRIMAFDPACGRVSFMRLQRIDGIKAGALVTAALKGDPAVLALRVEVEEGAGGFVAAMFGDGISGPFVFVLSGEAPVTAWKGKIHAGIGQAGDLDATIEVCAADDRKGITLSVDGGMQLAPASVPAWLAPLLAGRNRFALTGGFTQAKGIEIGRCTLETETAALQLSGLLDLKTERLQGDFSLRIDSLSVLEAFAGCELAGSVALNGKISGAALQPRVAISVKLTGLEAEKIRTSSIEGTLDLDFPGPLASPFPGLRISGYGAADGLVWQGAEPPETRIRWSLIAEGPVDDVISISKLELAGETLTLAASGRVGVEDLTGKAEIELGIHDLRPLSRFLGFELSGSTRVCASLEGNGRQSVFSARIRGKADIAEQDDSCLSAILAPEVVCAADIKLEGGTRLTISDFFIETAAVKLTAETFLDLSSKAVSGRWQFTLPQLEALSDVIRRPVAGSLRVDGEIGGSFDMARLEARATGNDLVMDGLNFEELDLTLCADGLPAKPEGHIRLDLRHGEDTILAEAGYIFEDQRILFSPISVQALAGELTGKLAFDMNSLLVRGDLDAACSDLSGLSVFLGKKLGGSVDLGVQFVSSEERQDVEFRFKGHDLATPFGDAGEVRLAGSVKDVYGAARGTAEIEARAIQEGELALATLSFSASGDKEEIAFSGSADGRYNTPFDVQAEGVLKVSAKGERLEITRFQGTCGDLPVAIAGPATFRHTSEGYSLDRLALNLGRGNLHASGNLGDKQVNITVDIEGLPLEALRPAGVPADLSGFMTGHLSATQERGEVNAMVQVHVTEVRPADSDLCFATVAAEAELRKGKVSADLTLEGLAEKPIKARLDLPVTLSLLPFDLKLPPEGDLEGHLAGEIDLARVGALLILDDQSVQGRLDVTLAVAGTVAAPNMTGTAHLYGGGYENVRSGTVLTNFDVRLTTKDSMIIIEETKGSDGNNGTVSVSGWLDFSADKGFPFECDIVLKDATVCRLDELTVVAGGEVALSGTPAEALVSGKLEVKSVEIRIPDRLPPEIAELEIVEINHPAGEPEHEPPSQRTSSRNLLLDIAIESPARVFLRGRGLDSEWGGAVRVTRNTDEPMITGDLSVLRGHFDFMGKRFSLNQGSLFFYGASPPDPFLDITCEAKNNDITAFLHVSGPISALELSISSEPPLPSDEIISRLLFGHAASEITPIQGLQLAYALNTLAGGQGDGWDVMGYTRNLLGVDRLEVKQSDENGEFTVGAGMYVNRGVYLELEQGLSPGSGKGTVQVEITPDVTIESEIGGELDAGIGIRWKHDY
jgi:translocation and assembly module TamB